MQVVFTSLAFVLSYLRVVTCVMDRTLENGQRISSVQLENGIGNLSWMYGHCISRALILNSFLKKVIYEVVLSQTF